MARKSLRRDESGGSLVEFALVLPMFLALLMAAFEVGIVGYESVNFNNALQATSRKIRTGQVDTPTSVASLKTAICASMTDANCASRLSVDVQGAGAGYGGLGAAQRVMDKATPPEPKPLSDPKDPPKDPKPDEEPEPPPPVSDPADGQFASSALTPNQIVVVTASYRWPVHAPFLWWAYPRTASGDIVLVSHLMFKNEPFGD